MVHSDRPTLDDLIHSTTSTSHFLPIDPYVQSDPDLHTKYSRYVCTFSSPVSNTLYDNAQLTSPKCVHPTLLLRTYHRLYMLYSDFTHVVCLNFPPTTRLSPTPLPSDNTFHTIRTPRQPTPQSLPQTFPTTTLDPKFTPNFSSDQPTHGATSTQMFPLTTHNTICTSTPKSTPHIQCIFHGSTLHLDCLKF